ncbi:MAG: DJ-1/PfpI/YhbO family deglycase/protease [candidate division Zixibacteria bacterium]|nr:DJ-1/PfpI/YhbO family deglycase/protease [candidate division Zixibacteria bacterium]
MALNGRKVAILVADYYEDMEFWYPYYRLKEEGAKVTVIGAEQSTFSSKHGLPAKSDIAVKDANINDFHALIIPGGYAPDHMRRSPDLIEFVREMFVGTKVIAAICHAGWVLASAGIINGKRITSFYSIKDDLVNAGGNWVDEEVVRDGTLITSRNPNDLPAFCKTIIATINELFD